MTPRRLTFAALSVGLVLLVSAAAAANEFTLTVVSQTNSTITFSYPQQAGFGYLYSQNGTVVSRTNDPTRVQVKFSKASTYEVAAIVKGTTGTYPGAPPPPSGDVSAPSAPGNIRAASKTQTQIVVVWDDAIDDVGVVNYRIYRNNALIGEGPGTSGGLTNQWTDSSLACGTNYTYGVEAQDAAGNTSGRPAVIISTVPCDTPPPAGNVISVSGTITAAALKAQIAAAPAGPVTVRPAAGQSSFTVQGDMAKCGCFDANAPDNSLSRQNVTLQHAVIGDLQVGPSGSGFVVEDSQVHAFFIDGASNWVIRRDNVDFGGVSHGAHLGFPSAGGSIMMRAHNWKILDSTFRGAYVTADPSQHTEAWFIATGNDGGLIQGNTFDDNGNTGHIFFSYWDFNPDNGPSPDPRNICVQNNTFTRSHNPYWHIDMRSELDWANNNIDVDPNTNTYDKPYSYTRLVDIQAALRPC